MASKTPSAPPAPAPEPHGPELLELRRPAVAALLPALVAVVAAALVELVVVEPLDELMTSAR